MINCPAVRVVNCPYQVVHNEFGCQFCPFYEVKDDLSFDFLGFYND